MKITYQAPEIRHVDIVIERGFAVSTIESDPDMGFESGNVTEGEW